MGQYNQQLANRHTVAKAFVAARPLMWGAGPARQSITMLLPGYPIECNMPFTLRRVHGEVRHDFQ
jgi:hypothetical protein